MQHAIAPSSYPPQSRRRCAVDSRMRVALALVGGLSLPWLVASCERSSLSDGLTGTQDCSACHGAPGNPAPPAAVNGATSTSDIGVGAHQVHLYGSESAGPVACSECHPLPSDYLTHPDVAGGPAHMTFGALSTRNGAVPVWDRVAATCANTYCHGATLSGAETRFAPVWTRVDGTQRRCSSCHGFPPTGTHPAPGPCDSCHADVAGPSGTIKNPARHVDGVIDVSSGAT